MAEIKKIKNVNYDFKNLTPFKWFVLENFPFIEEDFDALTNWQLFCKLGKYMNELINSQNSVGEQVEILTTAFNNLNGAFEEFATNMNKDFDNFTTQINSDFTDFKNDSNTKYNNFTSDITKSFQTLQNYVDTYFSNLDVTTEINAKLDSMIQDGSFQKLIEDAIKQSDIENIIKSYLTNVVYGYDTLTNLKAVTSIEAGNIVRTLGNQSMTDKKGSYYKIRTKTTSDVVDEDKIVSLTNFPDLVAEKIEETGSAVVTNDNPFDVPTICIGDEYILGIDDTMQILPTNKGWADYYKEFAGISDENFTKSGGVNFGFFGTPDESGKSVEAQRFETCLGQYTGDKSKVKRIIVMGGKNDINVDTSDLMFRINTFVTSVNNLYPNAELYVGMCFNTNIRIKPLGNMDSLLDTKNKIINTYLIYKNITTSGIRGHKKCYYINGIETVLKEYQYMNSESNLPNNNGYVTLASSLLEYFQNGSCYITKINTQIELPNIIPTSYLNITSFDGNTYISVDNGTGTIQYNNEIYFNNGVTSFTFNTKQYFFTKVPQISVPCSYTTTENGTERSYASMSCYINTDDTNGNTNINFAIPNVADNVSFYKVHFEKFNFVIPTVYC